VLEKRLPIEGEHVKVGGLLFVIDQQLHVAALAQTKAALAQSEAALAQSRRDLARAKSLSEIDAVSQQELDATVAKNDASLASVDASRAAVRTATLNLGYTTISSPIDGVMGRAQLRLGGLVTANRTVLTTLYHVNLSISEQQLLILPRQLGRAPNQAPDTHPLSSAPSSHYPHFRGSGLSQFVRAAALAPPKGCGVNGLAPETPGLLPIEHRECRRLNALRVHQHEINRERSAVV